MRNLFKPKPRVGLHFTADELRFIQLTKIRQGYKIENFAVTSIPADTVQNGKIKQFDNLLQVIKSLVIEYRITGYHTALAISAENIISKRIKLPLGLTKKEYETEIANNLPGYLKSTNRDWAFDMVKMDATLDGQQEWLLVAMPCHILNSYTALLHQAGLKIKLIDIDHYAEIRARESSTNITQAMHLAMHLDSSAFQTNAHKLQACIGAAMRKISLW